MKSQAHRIRNTAEEKALLLRLREGDYGAFEKVYNQHQRLLTGRLFRLLKSADLVEEVLQELFLRLWNHREQVDVEFPVRAYLFRIAENLVVDLYRKAARDKGLKEQLMISSESRYSHIEEGLMRVEDRTILFEAIAMLPEQQQRVYRMCKLDGLRYAEVAAKLGISEAAVNKHITKANRFLREYLSSRRGLVLAIVSGLITVFE